VHKSKAELRAQYKQVLEKNEFAKKIKQYELQRKDELPVHIAQYLFLAFLILAIFGTPIWGTKCFFISCCGGFLSVWIINIFKPEYITTETGKGNKRIIKPATKETHSDIEMLLKNNLMPELLSVFGNFWWTKHASDKSKAKFEKFKKLMIFPNCYKLNFDDCFSGSDDNISMEIMESKTENKLLSIIFSTLIVLSLLMFASLIILFPFVILVVPLSAAFNSAVPMIIGFCIYGILFVSAVVIWLYIILKVIRSEAFKGVVIEYRFPKKFKGWTFLYENKISAGNMNLKSKSGFEKIILEDVEFNKKYTVYSTDQVESRYLLTTGFIERFNNIKTAFKAEFIRAEFLNGELFLIMGVNKDLFKMGSILEETTYKTFLELFEEIYSVLDLAEQLKLGQNIGM